MSIINLFTNYKVLAVIGTAAAGVGLYAAKKLKEDEDAMRALGPDYDDRFFRAFARGYEEAKDLDW